MGWMRTIKNLIIHGAAVSIEDDVAYDSSAGSKRVYLTDSSGNAIGSPYPMSVQQDNVGLAKDGTDATGVTPPIGASGIRGWLSALYSLFNGAGAKVVMQRGATTVLNQAPASYTASGSTGNLSVGSFVELALDISITSVSGTTPTIVFYVDRLGADGNWYTIYTSNQFTGTATISTTLGTGAVTNQAFGNTIRLRWAIGGVSPSFTFSVSLIGK